MHDLPRLQVEIAHWAHANFGHNQSKHWPDVQLRSLAPLMGITEEVGEYYAATNRKDALDALGDIGIYLCDWSGREDLPLAEIILRDPASVTALAPCRELGSNGIIIALGNLYHATLKRHQGYDDITKYINDRDAACAMISLWLQKTAIDPWGCENYLNIINSTWDNIVSVTGDWYSLHSNFNVAGTATTRFSSNDPNSQNISKRSLTNLRQIFGPLPGREWYSLDYSNIELRIFAYESGDRVLIDAFEKGYSVHLIICEILHPIQATTSGCPPSLQNFFSTSFACPHRQSIPILLGLSMVPCSSSRSFYR